MTKKEFKRAMQCGLGRCIWELHKTDDLERYRDIILWGVTHKLSYDTQCEGTRAWYLYKMVSFFADVNPFIEAVISRGEKLLTKDDWLFMQCIEFLGFFAMDGNRKAYAALLTYYERLYQILLRKRKRTTYGGMPERDNFEQLCIIIVNVYDTKESCMNAYLKAAGDIGYLMSCNSLFRIEDFLWFQSEYENEFGETNLYNLLKRHTQKSEGIRQYLFRLQEKKKQEKYLTDKNKYPQSAKDIYMQIISGKVVGKDIPIWIVFRLSRNDNKQELLKLSDYYEKEKNPVVRMNLLRLLANSRCAYVLDADTVIADSKSENEELKQYAFRALSYMKNEKIHEYALELLKDWNKCQNIKDLYHDVAYFEDIVGMLANNYRKQDYALLVFIVKQIPVTYYGEINWHSVYYSVRDIFEEKGVKKPPKECLFYMYEHGLCSFCREYVLREMSRRRMLTEPILRECLYDANEDIREFARKKLKQNGLTI